MTQSISPNSPILEKSEVSMVPAHLTNESIQPAVQIRNLSVNFGDVHILNQVGITAHKGEIVTILGKSGSGKTTILKSIVGLIRPSDGSILLRGKNVITTPPENRKVGMVFQDSALFPHLTVFQNVAFPLIVEKTRGHIMAALKLFIRRPPETITRRVNDVLGLVHLESHADKLPGRLSGGEQQRVAIARALITSPDLLCLDEPFAALDRPMRYDLLNELHEINKHFNCTIIYVTHDSTEALSLSHKIAILHDATIAEFGEPERLYKFPKKAITARLLGQCNIFGASKVNVSEDCTTVVTANGTRFETTSQNLEGMSYVGIYPEDLRIAKGLEANTLHGTILDRNFLGNSSVLTVQLDTQDVVRLIYRDQSLCSPTEKGNRVLISYDSERVLSLHGPLEARSTFTA